MKKLIYLFLTLFTVLGYGQADFSEGVQISGGQPTVTSVNFLTTTDNTLSGLQGKIAPINLPIPYSPTNYSISNQSIGQHLTGIDTRLGQISSTTAGITQRVYFTADNTTVNSVVYFASSLTGKGSTATGSPSALVLADNTKAFFTKDVISIAQPSATIGYAGTYSGNLTVSATPTPVATQQRFTVEIYRTDNLGVPIASGVSGAPTGDLGVTVLAILDSGIINLTAGAITNVPVSGILTQNITLNTGERLRYHVSAAKIGTGGGNVTFGVYYGTSYNSYYDVPVAITTDAVLNKSTITPALTSSDALNALNSGKANLLGGNTFTGDQNLSSVNGNGRIGLLAITNNIAGTYNQPFYQSDFGYSVFRPYGTNLAQRSYLIPNGTPTGATSKFEMFNTDYYANAVTYAGLNIFTENTNNRINYGSNRGSGGGTRMGMLFYGDYVGSNSGAQNANSIQFYTNDNLALNEWTGAIGFGTDTPDQFGLAVANQYTFKNPTATSTRVNIVGNGTTAGLYFGRNAIRTIALESSLTTSDLAISSNASNSGTTLTKYFTMFGSTGNIVLQNGGAFTDNGLGRLQVNGNIFGSTSPTNAGHLTRKDYVDSAISTAFSLANGRPYKSYTVAISQNSTSAPTVSETYENTLSGTPVYAYSGIGTYTLTLTGAFTANKTYIAISNNGRVAGSPIVIYARRTSADVITINSYTASTLTDANIVNAFLEIRVYN